MIDTAEARRHATEYRAELMGLAATAPLVIEGMAAEIERLQGALIQIRARANSLQNADSHCECLRQLACIDHLAKLVSIPLEQKAPTADEPSEVTVRRMRDEEWPDRRS